MSHELGTEGAPLAVGEEFVRYQIRSLIGHGDHAYVYEAYDPFLDRDVAIKVIPDPPNSQRDLVQRALEHDAILRDLRHPNLASVFEVGTIGDNLVYIVMERLSGRTLRQLLLERHLLTPLEATEIGIQVAEGLAFAHAQLVIHRDLKPENIFILPGGEVKVINTGITSFIVPSGMVTERDRLRGTLLYMSPEHIQGFGVTDSCDMYSLGTVLYECLASVPPVLIGSENLTLDDVVWRQVAHMPPQLDELAPDMPTYLARTIQQMLAKEAVLRFATMDAVTSRLREAKRRIESGDADIPDSEPRKPARARAWFFFRTKRGHQSGGSAVAKAIAKRAAQLDAGVNSRCPPAIIGDGETPAGAYRKARLAAAIGLGALVGLIIAIYRTQPASDSTSPQVPIAMASSVSILKSAPPKLARATAHPGQVASASHPSSKKIEPGADGTPIRSDSYPMGGPSPLASRSPAPRQVVNPSPRVKRKQVDPGELVF